MNDREQVKKALTEIKDKTKKIDMLVNNAAVFNYDSPSSTSIDGISHHIINNTIAPVMLTKVLYKMKATDTIRLFII